MTIRLRALIHLGGYSGSGVEVGEVVIHRTMGVRERQVLWGMGLVRRRCGRLGRGGAEVKRIWTMLLRVEVEEIRVDLSLCGAESTPRVEMGVLVLGTAGKRMQHLHPRSLSSVNLDLEPEAHLEGAMGPDDNLRSSRDL